MEKQLAASWTLLEYTLHSTPLHEALEEIIMRIDNTENTCEKQHNADKQEQVFGKVTAYDMRERGFVGKTF